MTLLLLAPSILICLCMSWQIPQVHTNQIVSDDRHCIKVNNSSDKLICICDTTFCDSLEFTWPDKPGETYLIQSSEDGLRFDVVDLSDDVRPTNRQDHPHDTSSASNKIHIDLNTEYQTILGWGGAFTDAATININSLSESTREKLLASYYGKQGLQYNLGRVPIGGTDFSTRPYSYDDSEEADYNLTHWSLATEDLKCKIPSIKRAIQLTQEYNVDLKLFSSPWSPPKWMKTNNDFKRGHLIDDEKVYASYADYLLKFYEAYREHGINFWGATVQNEPVASNLPVYFFNSLQLSNDEATRLITKHLGPKLEAHGYTKDNFKLMVGDDSLGFVERQVPALLANEEVRRYVSGFAFHWYTSGSLVSYEALSKLVDSVKSHIEIVMMSEACNGAVPLLKHVDLGDWNRGQAYAEDIINDLQHQTNAWVDWNLALDLQGGPNWAGNFVDSPIIVDNNKDQFYKQPMYYVLAHFSRFFKEGSTRVEVQLSESGFFKFYKKLLAVGVYNKKTGHLIVNILNKSNHKKDIDIYIGDGTNVTMHGVRSITIKAKSISTLVLKL